MNFICMNFNKHSFLYIFFGLVFSNTLIVNGLHSQPITELRVIGNSANFLFNTIDQYVNGIDLTDRTTIRIRYQIAGKEAWQLDVWTDADSIEYQDGNTSSIPLDDFQLIATPVSSDDPTITYTNPFTPTTSEQVLAKGDGIPGVLTVEFKITYKLLPDNLGNKSPGLYYVPLNLLLKEQ